MSTSLGRLCIVLHGHLPYVLHHGSFPHGEAWLYEAAAETYLPLLDLIGDAAVNGIRAGLTVGLTPVLLEQLAHPRFKSAFVSYLYERMDRARHDRAEFEAANNSPAAALAQRWEHWYGQKLAQFERVKRDIPGEFAARLREGQIQMLTSNATHAYMPLLLNDSMLRAQMICGTQASQRHLSAASRGMWLPECAYRPAEAQWKPAVLYDDLRSRAGVETFIAGAGVTHFFVDTPLMTNATPIGTIEPSGFRAVNDAQLHWDRDSRGWNSLLEPVGVVSAPQSPQCFAFARHPRVSTQVWSGVIGYPGAGEYLDFHRKRGDRGLRYHKVTSRATPQEEKQPYDPAEVAARVHAQSQHFCELVRDTLQQFEKQTGRPGTVVAPFDAELFGHWWFEGPQFLRDVIFMLANDKTVELTTPEQVLQESPPDKVMRLPEGSWGDQGNHGVWLNDRTRWLWEIEYRAEGRFLQLLYELPWRKNAQIRQSLERAARELMLLQASDWPFVIHSRGADDYGIQRFSGHATRFDRMCSIAQTIAAGGTLGELEGIQIAELDAHDGIFNEIDLNWWM